MSDKRIQCIANPKIPTDMLFAVQQGSIVGGLRLDPDEPKDAVIYEADEARGMADLLGVTR